jgi:hypothetical protein
MKNLEEMENNNKFFHSDVKRQREYAENKSKQRIDWLQEVNIKQQK